MLFPEHSGPGCWQNLHARDLNPRPRGVGRCWSRSGEPTTQPHDDLSAQGTARSTLAPPSRPIKPRAVGPRPNRPTPIDHDPLAVLTPAWRTPDLVHKVRTAREAHGRPPTWASLLLPTVEKKEISRREQLAAGRGVRILSSACPDRRTLAWAATCREYDRSRRGSCRSMFVPLQARAGLSAPHDLAAHSCRAGSHAARQP